MLTLEQVVAAVAQLTGIDAQVLLNDILHSELAGNVYFTIGQVLDVIGQGMRTIF